MGKGNPGQLTEKGSEIMAQEQDHKDHRGPKPGAFVKGDSRINRSGRRRGSKNAPQILRDMRWVYKNPTAPPKSEGVKALQEIFNDDVGTFMKMYQRLESTFSKREAKEKSEEADPGTERALAHIDRLLNEWEEP